MALVQRPPDLDWVVQVAAVLFLFVLPVLRSILEARKTREQERARRTAGEAPERPRRRPPAPRRERELEEQERRESGREAFERLLRGEAPVAAAPAAPPAPPQRPPPLVLRSEAVSLEEAPPPPLVQMDSLPPVPREEQLEQGLPPAAAPHAARVLAPAFAVDLDTLLEAAEDVDEERRAPLRLGAGDLRRAVVLAELLAPPLALRGEGGGYNRAPGLA